MKNKKEMTINDLAIIINKSFDHVYEKFDKVDKRLEKLEQGQKETTIKLENLEKGQKEIKQDLTFTARKFELKELEVRVEKLEYKFAKMAK